MNDQSNVLTEDNWKVERLPYTEDCPTRGFLQLCADRRFHKLIQQEFKKDAGLDSREDYWIHAETKVRIDVHPTHWREWSEQ